MYISASSKCHSRHEEEGLCGMLKLCTAVMRHNPPFKYSDRGLVSSVAYNTSNTEQI